MTLLTRQTHFSGGLGKQCDNVVINDLGIKILIHRIWSGRGEDFNLEIVLKKSDGRFVGPAPAV